jgi:hypothetical protein
VIEQRRLQIEEQEQLCRKYDKDSHEYQQAARKLSLQLGEANSHAEKLQAELKASQDSLAAHETLAKNRKSISVYEVGAKVILIEPELGGAIGKVVLDGSQIIYHVDYWKDGRLCLAAVPADQVKLADDGPLQHPMELWMTK